MKVGVVGGGISGLTAAYYLSKLPKISSITVYEASDRLGGWIQTTKRNGLIYEHGPRTIRPAGPQGANTLELVADLGLNEQIIPIKYGHPATINRMVYVNGGLHKLPTSLKSLLTVQSPFSRPLFLAGLREFFTPQKPCEDESIYDFVQRRFGAEIAQFAIDPMVRGICAGDAKQISAKAFVAAPLFNLEQEYGGIFRGLIKRKLMGKAPPKEELQTCSAIVKKARDEKWNVWTLKGGLEALITSLATRLVNDGIDIRLQAQVLEDHDFTFWSTPAYASAQAVPQLRDILSTIPYVDVAVVNVMFDADLVPDPGFGFLVPSTEREVPILGVIFDTCSIPQGRDRSIFTVMMGGAWFNQLFGAAPTTKELQSIAVQHLKSILKIDKEPTEVICKIHEKCIAQYTVGHAQRVAKARQLIRREKLPLALIGSAYDGVGINDAIMSSKTQVANFASSMK